MNAGRPSVRHTLRTQSRVDLYFCPSAAEKPSVCIRDLTMSIGYMTAQSCGENEARTPRHATHENPSQHHRRKRDQKPRRSTHGVPGRGPKEHGVRGIDLVAADALARHLALHELLVRPEVDAVSDGLAPEGDDLALVDPREAVLAPDLLHGVKRPGVYGMRRGLGLQA